MKKSNIIKIFFLLFYTSKIYATDAGDENVSLHRTKQFLTEIKHQLKTNQQTDFHTIYDHLSHTFVTQTNENADTDFLNQYFSMALLHNAQTFNETPEFLSEETYQCMLRPLSALSHKLSAQLLTDILARVNGHLSGGRPDTNTISPESRVSYSFARLITGNGRFGFKKNTTQEDRKRLAASIFRQYNANDPRIDQLRTQKEVSTDTKLNQLWQEIVDVAPEQGVNDLSDTVFVHRVSCFMIAAIGMLSSKGKVESFADINKQMFFWISSITNTEVLKEFRAFLYARFEKMHGLLASLEPRKIHYDLKQLAITDLRIKLPIQLLAEPLTLNTPSSPAFVVKPTVAFDTPTAKPVSPEGVGDHTITEPLSPAPSVAPEHKIAQTHTTKSQLPKLPVAELKAKHKLPRTMQRALSSDSSRLRNLNFGTFRTNDACIQALVPYLEGGITNIAIGGEGITDATIDSLTDYFAQAVEITLFSTNITEQGWIKFFKAISRPDLPTVITLILQNNKGITDTAFEHFIAGTYPFLDHLDVGKSSLTEASNAKLMDAKRRKRLPDLKSKITVPVKEMPFRKEFSKLQVTE